MAADLNFAVCVSFCEDKAKTKQRYNKRKYIYNILLIKMTFDNYSNSKLLSSKNAFIMQSKSTFLEFLRGIHRYKFAPPPQIFQGRNHSGQMT